YGTFQDNHTMFQRTSHILLVLALCGLVLPSAIAHADSSKANIAIVNMQRVINETKQGKASKARLERDMKRRQDELTKKEKEFQKYAADLKSSYEMLTDDAKAKRMQEYQQKATELQKAYATHQQALAKAEQQATSKIVQGVLDVVETIAKKNHYTLVV